MDFISRLIDITVNAGLVAMKYYNQSYNIKNKDDQTPVTEADLAVNDFIITSLTKLYPDIAILSEENSKAENLNALNSKRLFIIDPIDGTEAFIEKRPEFTINIGLVENNQFKSGFVYVPRLDILYYNDYENAYKVSNASGQNPVKNLLGKKEYIQKEQLTITTSHRIHEILQIEKELQQLNIKVKEFIRPSSSYKFCLVAEDIADLYLRRPQAGMKIWDAAAAIAILNASNKLILDLNFQEINFNSLKSGVIVPPFNIFAFKQLITLFKSD